jgi:hypothetical protein
MTTWDGKEICDQLVAKLPETTTDAQKQAKQALENGNYNLCKVLAACYLDDAYVKACGYMSSIPGIAAKGMHTLPTLVGEASRSIADSWHQWSLSNGHTPTEAEAKKAVELIELSNLNRRVFAKALS